MPGCRASRLPCQALVWKFGSGTWILMTFPTVSVASVHRLASTGFHDLKICAARWNFDRLSVRISAFSLRCSEALSQMKRCFSERGAPLTKRDVDANIGAYRALLFASAFASSPPKEWRAMWPLTSLQRSLRGAQRRRHRKQETKEPPPNARRKLISNSEGDQTERKHM